MPTLPFNKPLAESFSLIISLDIIAAIATHTWLRKFEPTTLRQPLLAFLVIPGPLAYTSYLSSGVSSIFAIYALFIATLIASTLVYRVSPFHPLAKYPGPLLCKLSKLWPAYIAYHGRLHHYYKSLHDIYGPVVRIGPNELSVIDKEAVLSALGSQGMPKGPLWEGRRFDSNSNLRSPTHNGLISVRDLRRHTQLRKPWNKAFGSTPLKDYEDIMIERAAQLSGHFHTIIGKSADSKGHVDLAKWIGFFSFDFMGDMAFGGGFEMMSEGDNDKIWPGMERALSIYCVTQHIPWAATLLLMMPFINTEPDRFQAFSVRQATIRTKANTQKRDLFYYLLSAADPDSKDDPFPLVVANAGLAIVAGSDTTASVISNIVYYLLRYPKYFQLLRSEVDDAFPVDQNTVLDTGKLPGMKMLNAIINETLRLQPPVPTGIQRSPTKDSGGKVIGNMFINEETGVTIPTYALHREPQYFSPRPNDFWPERWILAEDEKERKRHNIVLDQAAFIPFSMGPANCAGKTLAILELRYITAMFLREFNFEFEAGYSVDKWEKDLEDRFVIKKGSLPVVLTARKAS